MRPIRETIPLDEALATILESVRPVERIERVALPAASGRVVASPPMATLDVPPFDRAAMDGYAVRAEDTFGAGRFDPKVFRVIEKVYTGQVPTTTVGSCACVEIATGAQWGLWGITWVSAACLRSLARTGRARVGTNSSGVSEPTYDSSRPAPRELPAFGRGTTWAAKCSTTGSGNGSGAAAGFGMFAIEVGRLS